MNWVQWNRGIDELTNDDAHSINDAIAWQCNIKSKGKKNGFAEKTAHRSPHHYFLLGMFAIHIVTDFAANTSIKKKEKIVSILVNRTIP